MEPSSYTTVYTGYCDTNEHALCMYVASCCTLTIMPSQTGNANHFYTLIIATSIKEVHRC